MEVMAGSKIEADSQLEQIRKQWGFEGHDQATTARAISSVDWALDFISDQLYQTPTHFLLELIQNADDNRYHNHVVPSLSLLLYERDGQQYFRTDCNEVGFTFGQIDALAGLGKSTKRVVKNSGQRGYIGEKGIGFKSVFKVADVVNVVSGNYQFKLDRNQPIGMVLPILSPFPCADLVSNHTQFLLEVKRRNDYLEIERELGEVRPELLIFLRKLTRLVLSFPGNRRSSIFDRSVNVSDQDFGGDVETITLSAATHGVDPRGILPTTQKKYIVHRREVRNLPPDPSREGISTSEVTLAFPFADDGYTPIIESQETFAFLPIDDFGFKFVMHADFLLVASREALEYRRPWNLALRDGIRDAFLAAIESFAGMRPRWVESERQLRGLCFTWPKYLGRTPRGNSFWDGLHADIINHLKQASILLPEHGLFKECRKPGTLRYVPAEYRFGAGTLFGPLSNASSHDHLAFDYDDVWLELLQLGVQRLSLDELCSEFELWVARVGVAGIKRRHLSWHEQVSRLFCGNWSLRARLRKLPIIPLRNGAWGKAESERMYLNFQSEDDVPGCLDISIVDPTASQNKARRHFFEFLGIKEYTPRQVCDVILNLHHNLDTRTPTNLISDVAYLFKHRSLLGRYVYEAPEIFFVVTRDGKRVKRKVGPIYYDDPRVQPNLIKRYKSSAGNPFWILDDGYEAVICTDRDPSARAERQQEFSDWLLRFDTIWRVPELVQNGRLTQEWAFLRDTNVIDLLHALRHHVRFLSSVVPPVLVKAVPELQVRCRDGSQRHLGLLALPTEELIRECPHIDFVDLPESGFMYFWNFLSQFGVLCTCDTTARLRELRALSERFQPDGVNKEAVHGIYRALNSALCVDDDEIRAVFNKNPVVLIPDGRRPRWIRHDRCVWNAPPLLQQAVRIRPYYQDCERLFTQILGVKQASLDDVVHEFCSESRGNGKSAVQRFEKLLLLLADFVSKSRRDLTDIELMRIRTAAVFPILQERDTPQENPAVAWRSISEGGWNIPDDIILESVFRGKVCMLDMSVRSIIKSIKPLKTIFEALGCTNMLLSCSVQQTVEPRGNSERDLSMERELRTRVEHLSQLPKITDAADYTHLLICLLIRVWRVPSITITRRLSNVEIRADDGLVKVHKHDIYLPLDIPGPRQAEVNYELGSHFANLLGTENASWALLNLLMSAPVSQLAGILQRHNILPPGGIGSGADTGFTGVTDCEDVSSASDAREGWKGNDIMPMLKMGGLGIPVTVTSTSRDDEDPPTPPAATQLPGPSDGLAPSHQSRTQDISQIANRLDVSDFIVARSPTQSLSGLGTPDFGATTKQGRGTDIIDAPGTAVAVFSPMVERGPYDRYDPSRSYSHQSILFMDIYKKWQGDELRLADYRQGRKPGGPGALRNFEFGGMSGFGDNSSGTEFGASIGTGMSASTQPTTGGFSSTTATTARGSSDISTLSLPIRTRGGWPVSLIDNPEQEARRTSPGDSDSSPSRFSRPSATASCDTPDSTHPRPSASSEEKARTLPKTELRYREIGFHGELLIHKFFERHIGDWTFDNWTSKLRSEAGHPQFTQREKDFSDFTYHDTSEYMKKILGQFGAETERAWSRNTTYHFEVKTTSGICNEPCFVSQNQVDMMRTSDGDPDNAYILLRVFNIEGDRPGVKLYTNPWRLYMARVLEFRSDVGYKVYSNDEFRNYGAVELHS